MWRSGWLLSAAASTQPGTPLQNRVPRAERAGRRLQLLLSRQPIAAMLRNPIIGNK